MQHRIEPEDASFAQGDESFSNYQLMSHNFPGEQTPHYIAAEV
jgi:hypothetical protein